MKHDFTVDGEAMSAVEGNDITHLIGSHVVIDMQEEPQRAAFNAYRVAFRGNEANPTLKTAVALVDAARHMGEVMGLDLV